MKAEDMERISKGTTSGPENFIHLPFEKHARIGRRHDGDYIYGSKLICEYTPEQALPIGTMTTIKDVPCTKRKTRTAVPFWIMHEDTRTMIHALYWTGLSLAHTGDI